MSLLMDATNETVNFGSNVSLDDVFTGSFRLWFKYNTDANDFYIVAKNTSGSFGFGFQLTCGTTEEFRLEIEATGAFGNLLQVNTSGSPLTAGEWNYVCGRWAEGGGNSAQQLAIGTLAVKATEPSYNIQKDTVTNLVSNAAFNLIMGPTLGFMNTDMDVAYFEIFDSNHALQDLIDAQYVGIAGATLGNCVGSYAMWDTNTVFDLSGNANNGTVSNATKTDMPPVRYRRMGTTSFFMPSTGIDRLMAASISSDMVVSPSLAVDRNMISAIASQLDVSPVLNVDRDMHSDIASALAQSNSLAVDRDMHSDIASSLAMSADLQIGGIVLLQATITSVLGNTASLAVERVLAADISSGLDMTSELSLDKVFAAAIASELGNSATLNIDRGLAAAIQSMMDNAAALAIDRVFGANIASNLTVVASLQVAGVNDVLLQASLSSSFSMDPSLRISPFAPIDELEDLDLQAPWYESEENDKLRYLVKNFDRIREAFTARPTGSFETLDGKVIVIKNGVVTEIYEK